MRPLLCLTLCWLLLSQAGARSRRVSPGKFDYYILALSWAPDFCDRPNVQHDPRECGPGRRLGFVVHGLWPQLADGDHPTQCATARPVGQSIVQRTLAYIPSESLIQHEWRDHGTCSGLTPTTYFEAVRRAFEAIKIPAELKQLNHRLDISPRELQASFAAANPGFKDSFRVACSGGELSEVRVCMSKGLSPQPCGPHDTQCPASRIGMLPVQ